MKDDWNLNPGIEKRGFCNTNFLRKSVDFEYFLVKDDGNLNPGLGKRGLAIQTFYIKVLILNIFG